MCLNIARPDAIDVLLSRRSVKTRDMVEPGPSDEEMAVILKAGMRVPDHGKLSPWRFFVYSGTAREALADIISDAFCKESQTLSDAQSAKMQRFAVQAPRLVILASCPSREKPIPDWEQHLSAGASAMSMLIAAHMLGYVGQWLTDWPAYSPRLKAHLGLGDADKIAGFLFFGSAGDQPPERPRPDPDSLVQYYRTRADLDG
ncbi:nitroreductase [Iodidimonas gelatinilytica]|uniref:Putative NAD(P)H nitroreductase n=1 Tax=Iodidimonas gelatinilytica TaxID=1236966 RepID=A0A5A7MUW7_9PROT|nr:nitroreductase [Iodidimonas gelatinilytica]GEQ97297.1 nitroreductase [Iodidimonas gelatinilytica]GEQ99626.1 nitroreductase [Iodidimonas gelatinilytica]